MLTHCKANLFQIKNLLSELTDEQYKQSLTVFSGSSIGQHTRHILEFYDCLRKGVSDGTVNYDLRVRDLRLEQSRQFAMQNIDALCADFLRQAHDTPMILEADFNTENSDFVTIKSSFYRELAYCLEHSIHHQALLKIGVIALGLSHCIPADFGVASSTIRHQKNTTVCVQ
jgi:uncharacterized damage-inducible protein DinB